MGILFQFPYKMLYNKELSHQNEFEYFFILDFFFFFFFFLILKAALYDISLLQKKITFIDILYILQTIIYW